MFVSKNTSKEAEKWLPTNLGGKGESYESLAQYWRQTLEENADFFRHMDQFKSIPKADQNTETSEDQNMSDC